MVFLDLGTVGKYTSNLRLDCSQGICQAIDHLDGLGHKDFAFIAGPQTVRSAISRQAAFVNALRQRGLETHRILEGNHQVDGGIRAVQALLAQRPLPTAILCSNDITAIGALHALQHAGIRVSQDVSVVGFDNIDLAAFTAPPLTTISVSRQLLGQLAVQALEKILKSKRRMGVEYVLETELVVRQSTAAPGKERTTSFPKP